LSDERLKAALGYPKFTSNTKMLVLKAKYLVVGDVIAGANALGWEVETIDIKHKGTGDGNFIGTLLTKLVTFKPDFLITINHLGFDEGGVLSELLEKYNIPLASWFVDHPLPILGGAANNATSNCQVFCFERTAIDWLNKSGYNDTKFLPTGSNQEVFHPKLIKAELVQKLKCNLSFAGSSWWTKARTEPVKKVRKAAKELSKKKKFHRSMVANEMELLIDKVKKSGDRTIFGAAQTVLAEASMQTRKKFITALKPHGIKIYGDDNWERLINGIKASPYLDYCTDLPALFAGSKINANVTAEQMPTAVNQRVWDVPGCGGFVLTDAQEDVLDNFKEDIEAVVYRSFEEAYDKAKYYIEHDNEREKISQKAYLIVEARHRITHRMQTIASVMKKRFA